MKREDAIDELESFLIELLEKERFEFLEPYMNAGEGCPANVLIGSPAKEILDFIETRLGMAPPFYDKEQDNNGDKVIVPSRSWE